MSWNDLVEVYFLAAGRSERMGASKPMLAFTSGTVLSTMVSAFNEAGLHRIRVIGRGDDADLARETNVLNARYIFNLEPEIGMSGSILEALEDCRSPWMCLTPSDIPLLSSETITACLQALDQAQIVQPECSGKGKHPIFIKSNVFLSLRPFLRSGGTLRDFLATQSVVRVSRSNPTEFLDMDTPEDYVRLLQEVGLGPN